MKKQGETTVKLWIEKISKTMKAGDSDPQIGIYRDAEDGACESCMQQDAAWKERSLDEIIVYNSQFQVEVKGQ